MSWLLKSKRLQSAGHGVNGGIYNNVSSSHSSNSLIPQHHHLDPGEDMVRQIAASHDTQKTTFMHWVNFQLAKIPNQMPMTAIDRDLRDGKRLVALLEHVSKEPLKPERGGMRIHQMANVTKAIAFLEKRTDEDLTSIGSEDIVDGKLKLTLGLIWIIIYRFQIQQIANTMAELCPFLTLDDVIEGDESPKGKKKSSSQQIDAKQALLRWVRYQLEDYSDVIPPIQDFHRSWRTGLAFAALIHRHDPDFLPEFYSDILPLPFETNEEWRAILSKAFEVALLKMSLPRLLEPDDLVVETPDERCIMTYVSEYYIVMSKHQVEQDPALTAELRARRLQAKHDRLALAGEDQQTNQRRLQEEDDRRLRDEQEESERIRLKRMEIEGWPLRAAERVKEEEEANKKKREEEEDRRLQRKLNREQREREKNEVPSSSSSHPPIQQQASNSTTTTTTTIDPSSSSTHDDNNNPTLTTTTADTVITTAATPNNGEGSSLSSKKNSAESSGMDSVSSESEHEYSDTDTEPTDPREQENRQSKLEEKLNEYRQGVEELLQWVREQDEGFPQIPDTSTLLDRARDLDPLIEGITAVEEEQTIKEHIMSHFHDVREELLEFETPNLNPDQVSEVDKRWWDLEVLWNIVTEKVLKAKDVAGEIKWIIDCSQEITRVNGEISKFEAQLEAFAEKRTQETLQERSQIGVLEEQDLSLKSISFLLKTYLDFLRSLMDPKVHHHTAPEHLTALKHELTEIRLPRLGGVIENAQHNLDNDRLLRAFLESFAASNEWIGESIEWLANIQVPIFVSKDHWNGGSTVKEYLARDASQDPHLDFFQKEVDEHKGDVEEEQSDLNTIRASGLAKLDEQSKDVVKSVTASQDVTAEGTIKTVEDLMHGLLTSLEKVERLLPKETEHCTFAARVLDHLRDVEGVLVKLEEASAAIDKWEMRQPDAEVEALVIQTETKFEGVDSSLKNDQGERTVLEVVQARHSGLSLIVKNLRVCFLQKQEAIKGDRMMKEFLDRTRVCQTALQNFKTKFQDPAPLTGFGSENLKAFDDFTHLVHTTGESFDKYENDDYAGYLEMGTRVKTTAVNSNARQDPAVVQSKLHNLSDLLNNVKTLKADRERDMTTVAECRKLTASLATLRSDLETLEKHLTELEHLEPHQENDLVELGHRANHLNSQFALLEQENVFRILTQDPSCSKMFKDISQRQQSIQTTQERLQAKLEVKQQWNMAWDSFDERTKALQQYLEDVEQSIQDRGFVSLDILADDESVWKRTDDAVRDAEVGNGETVNNLEDFSVSRMPELLTLAKALQQVVELAGGIEHMDETRAEQFRESERLQQWFQDRVQQVGLLNDHEKHQLDTLQQRLVWSQQLAESKVDVDVLKNSCEDALSQFVEILKSCGQSGDTTGLNDTAAEQLKQQAEHLVSLAAKQKQARFDDALNTYSSLKELILTPNKDSKDDSEKSIPAHLEKELSAFKAQYDHLDHQLDYACQLADHAHQVALYLEKNDTIDIKLGAVAVELKCEMEATQEAIDQAETIRADVQTLSKELEQIMSSGPRSSDDDTQSASNPMQNEYPTLLESLLKKRFDHTSELSEGLSPLLEDYKELLQYQDGLRTLAKDLETHGEWLQPSNDKVCQAGDRLQDLFSSWPTESSTPEASQSSPDSVTMKKQSDELNNLQSVLNQEAAHVENKEQEFEALKNNITEALQKATIHSKQLQFGLEKSLDSIEDKVQELKTDMRHKSQQLECLEKQLAWEQELEGAKTLCRDLDNDIAQFTTQQAMWKMTGSSNVDSAEAQQQLEQFMDRAVADFEARLKSFEDQQKPKVDQAWAKVCGAVSVIEKSMPADFETRNDGLGEACQELRTRMAYTADVVKQRKALENMNARIRELEGLQADLASRSINSDENLE
ncbi:hypothetical protein BGZ65_001863, partial [Modicella reniformis]